MSNDHTSALPLQPETRSDASDFQFSIADFLVAVCPSHSKFNCFLRPCRNVAFLTLRIGPALLKNFAAVLLALFSATNRVDEKEIISTIYISSERRRER